MFAVPESLDLSREILAVTEGQARAPGHSVPATTGAQAQGVGRVDEGVVQRLYPRAPCDLPDRDDRGPAMRHSANDYAWRQQARFEVGPCRETVASYVVPPGGVLTLDPSLAITWRAILQGDCSIVIAEDEPAPDFDPAMPAQMYATHLVLVVRRAPGAKITWPSDLLWPEDLVEPERLVAPDPAASKVDVFTLYRMPPSGEPDMPVGWLASLGGRGFAVRKTVLTAPSGTTPDVS